jgi:hypothetical protein
MNQQEDFLEVSVERRNEMQKQAEIGRAFLVTTDYMLITC